MKLNLKFRSPLALIVMLLMFSVAAVFSFSSNASALSGSDFNAGRIIDDAVFFNPNTMSSADIQAFLNAKVPVCDTSGNQPRGGTTRAAYGTSQGYPPPYTCLKDYTQSVPNKAPDAYCSGSVSSGTKTAAAIIYDVSQACSVNPKVLIVLLQKEQSLVTDDWPWSIQYRSATGYGCPDSAPCDSEYYGFFNQVYNAARQYQRYVKQSSLFNFRGGQTSYIQYNPNAGCGGTNVGIQNQATAALYNYTPYQPNQAALNNLYGTGDGCSAYGNRNFWRMYIDWFGSTYTTTAFAWMGEGQEVFSDAAMTQPFTHTSTTTPGGKIYVRVKARNMGNHEWNPSFVRLGTWNPADRSSRFYDISWPDRARPTQLKESSVAPGQIGTFEFTLKAPTNPGTYREPFNIVAEGVTWLNDVGFYIPVNVNTSAPVSNVVGTRLTAWQVLYENDYLMSPDSQTVLTLQGDGNLVEYTNMNASWHAGVAGGGGYRLVMQGDGNLVLYRQNGVPVWASGTDGNPGAYVQLQTDGNIVIYSTSNVALWSTRTTSNPDHLAYVNPIFHFGRMYPGQSLTTAARNLRLVLQGDGNLVLYKQNGAVLWASGTDGMSVAFLSMQGDGNLVLYARRNGTPPPWNSRTSGTGASDLVLQEDGNLVLYNNRGTPLWATWTAGR